MQDGGVEDAACGELTGQVGAVVVHEALELFDGGREGGAGCAVGRGKRAQSNDLRWVEERSEEVEYSGMVEGA